MEKSIEDFYVIKIKIKIITKTIARDTNLEDSVRGFIVS